MQSVSSVSGVEDKRASEYVKGKSSAYEMIKQKYLVDQKPRERQAERYTSETKDKQVEEMLDQIQPRFEAVVEESGQFSNKYINRKSFVGGNGGLSNELNKAQDRLRYS